MAAVDELILQKRPDIGLSLNDYTGGWFDTSPIDKLPSLQSVSIATCRDDRDLSPVTRIHRLNSFRLEKPTFPGADFFEALPAGLISLRLGESLKKKGSIAWISRFKQLRHLRVTGPAKDAVAIGSLTNLETLNLRTVTTPDLEHIGGLRKLKQLKLALGGTKSLAGIEPLKGLEYLELWLVKNLAEVGPIAELTGLQTLRLQAMRNITTLPSLERLKKLRYVILDTMKGLRDMTGIARAPNLDEVRLVAAEQIVPEDLDPLLRHKKLHTLACGTGSRKRNDAIHALVSKHGKQTN